MTATADTEIIDGVDYVTLDYVARVRNMTVGLANTLDSPASSDERLRMHLFWTSANLAESGQICAVLDKLADRSRRMFAHECRDDWLYLADGPDSDAVWLAPDKAGHLATLVPDPAAVLAAPVTDGLTTSASQIYSAWVGWARVLQLWDTRLEGLPGYPPANAWYYANEAPAWPPGEVCGPEHLGFLETTGGLADEAPSSSDDEAPADDLPVAVRVVTISGCPTLSRGMAKRLQRCADLRAVVLVDAHQKPEDALGSLERLMRKRPQLMAVCPGLSWDRACHPWVWGLQPPAFRDRLAVCGEPDELVSAEKAHYHGNGDVAGFSQAERDVQVAGYLLLKWVSAVRCLGVTAAGWRARLAPNAWESSTGPDAGPDTDTDTDSGALTVAARAGDLDTVERALKKGPGPVTVLSRLAAIAAQADHDEVVFALFDHGAAPQPCMLDWAARRAEIPTIRRIMALEWPSKAADSQAALRVAAGTNSADSFRALLTAGATLPTGQAACDLLYLAAQAGSEQVTRALLEAGAPLRPRYKLGGAAPPSTAELLVRRAELLADLQGLNKALSAADAAYTRF